MGLPLDNSQPIEIKLIKISARSAPKISLILLDWSVRESFHLLYYLSKQNVPRDIFEVILVEYYSRVSIAAQKFENQIDSWVLLKMPEEVYYHKHLMYNAGIVLSQGEICVICDSDAMVKESFIESIIKSFTEDNNIVLHFDQFRNISREFYPFNFPDFDAILGNGCINNVNGKTSGLVEKKDAIHVRNYGACMCARREHMIAIGGADEHIDFLGHICGPYDMTFRLLNNGLREVWHQNEFLYHTWHPGQAGVDNYSGPHDGRQISTTALDALRCGRIMPLDENEAIKLLRTGVSTARNKSLLMLISERKVERWKDKPQNWIWWSHVSAEGCSRYKGFEYGQDRLCYTARPVIQKIENSSATINAASIKELKQKIDAFQYTLPQMLMIFTHLYSFLCQILTYIRRYSSHTSSKSHNCNINEVSFLMRDMLSKIERFGIESRFVGSLLSELVAVLWLLRKTNNRNSPYHGIIVIIDRPAYANLLYMFQKLRVLPRLIVKLIIDEDSLGHMIVDSHLDDELIVVHGRVFFRLYQKIATIKQVDKIIVS
jgi:hypothetical protein